MKKKTNAQLKKQLWKVFSEYIRRRDRGICFTCGRFSQGSGYHAGHFVPKSIGGLSLYFNEENVNGQCFNCNINLGGNQYIYSRKLGKKAEALYALKGKIIKDFPYEERINYYKSLLEKNKSRPT